MIEGKCSDGNRTEPVLYKWMQDLLKAATQGSPSNTSCYGDIDNPPNATAFNSENYTTYCDSDVYPKILFSASGKNTAAPTPSPSTESGSSSEDDEEQILIITVGFVLLFIAIVGTAVVVYCFVCPRMKRCDGGEADIFFTGTNSSSRPAPENEL